MAAALIGYLLLFFAQPDHRAWLLLPLVPDLIAERWFGGKLASFSVADRLPLIATAVMLSAIASVLGNGMMRLFKLRGMTRLEEFAFSIGAGFSLMSAYTLVMGLAGLLHSRAMLMGPLVVAALLIGYLLRGRSERNSDVSQQNEKQNEDDVSDTGARVDANDETLEQPAKTAARSLVAVTDVTVTDAKVVRNLVRGWCLVSVLLGAIMVAGSLLPPWEFDVLEYHLQVPKEWLRSGRITFLPHNVYGNMPLGAEMHALLAMVAIGGDDGWWRGAIVGKLIMTVFSLLTAVLVYSTGRRLFSPLAGVMASAIYLGIPWVAHVSVTGLIDGVVAFYVIATVSLLLRWRDQHRGSSSHRGGNGWLLFAGWMAGSAAAVKYPPLVMLVLPIAVWLFAVTMSDGGWKLAPSLQRAALFLAMAFAACGGWYAKNGLLTGNPVYPLAYRWFDGATRTVAKDQQWRDAHRDRDAEGRSYTLPQCIRSAERVLYKSEWLSPVLMPLAICGFIASRGRKLRSVGLLIAVYLSLWWLVTHRIDRFWIPVMPLLALFAGAGATAAGWRASWSLMAPPFQMFAQWLIQFVVLVSSILAMFVSSCEQPGVIRDTQFFVSLESLRQQYSHPVHRWLNERYASDVSRDGRSTMRVLLVGDAQPFMLDAPVLYNTCFDDCLFEQFLSGKSRRERLESLRAAGITHVFIYWREIARYRATYGYSAFVTPELVHGELVREQKLLRAIPIEFDLKLGELFTVSGE